MLVRRCVFALLLIASTASAAWDPAAYTKEDTLEFLTVGPEEGEHWSPVWLVVIDDQVYVRLGSRAAERMEANTTKPFVKVKIAGETFDRVKAESAPEMADAVNQAMHDKYTSDIIVQYFSHPLTMRLTPDAQ